MAYINIPSLNYSIDFSIKLHDSTNKLNENYISNSLYKYLINIKQQIHNNNNNWDFYKKITNPYEYIHTPYNYNKTYSICKYKPLSRSFFKMIEIINVFNILNDENNIRSFHLAEGPGGFIEAFNYYRNNKSDIYYGMTLISNNINVPSWKKSNNFINSNKNIKIIVGESKNGDLFLKKNLLYINNNFKESMDYITGDGGFDFSVDFNKQEELSLKLIISQIFYALIMQKNKGTFVLKIFDMFNIKTIEMLFLLTNCYENIYIYKPNTSRVANSEKYIICKNFKLNNFTNNIKSYIINNYDYILNNLNSIKTFFNIKLPLLFLNKIEEINAIYGQQQLENINNTLNLIREYNNLNIELPLNQLDNILIINNINNNNNNNNNNNHDHDDNTNKTNISKLDNISEPIDINNSINKVFDENFSLSPINSEKFSTSPKDLFLLDKDKDELSINDDINNMVVMNNDSNNSNNSNDNNDNNDNDNNDNDNNDNNKINKNSFDKFQNRLIILKNINIQKSITWCNKYNLPINKIN